MTCHDCRVEFNGVCIREKFPEVYENWQRAVFGFNAGHRELLYVELYSHKKAIPCLAKSTHKRREVHH